jgi:tetratricopeptide (TPR) repeat protein
VASRLLKGLGSEARAAFELEMLRPATFEQLALVLRRAKEAGRPYHIVHFDGHGLYLDEAGAGDLAALRQQLSHLLLSGLRHGAHGYLAFENPSVTENMQLVDGPSLGRLLVETDVSFLILNACRSAHADPLDQPEPKAGDGNTHDAIRALGSLAQEVVDTGVPGVVAMRYNVYVVTAAQFVADLYAALARGQTLGAAVTLGRKQLHANPQREIALKPIPLQDWCVPVVFEAAPVALFPKPLANAPLFIKLETTPKPAERPEETLPPPPDAGFYGRDETLLAVDRACDSQSIVLLHAFAGSGKTSTAAEFARWYQLTGGIQGPVLFTSFEQHRPLARVLDQMGRVFGTALERAGVHWLTLDDAQRRETALQLMKQVPLLWIWDNVEPVAGFPTGTPSVWSETEQKELVDFLRAARDTRAKFLLTSRRDEQGWLGDLPARITVPPMPLQESVQLVRALAARRGKTLAEVEDWRPLLKFAGGNPLTITVVVGQALRDGLRTREQIEVFVEKLRAGETAFEDDTSQGRSKSLGASLNYGFENAFTQDERRQLALLHLFRGFVDANSFRLLGSPKADWSLRTVCGITRQSADRLLTRAMEIGLLTRCNRHCYFIHPALPLHLRNLFDRYFPQAPANGEPSDSSERAIQAYSKAVGAIGNALIIGYQDGSRNVLTLLSWHEANFLRARRLAMQHAWWRAGLHCMQALDVLYRQTGRRSEFERLVLEIVPLFVDPASNLPIPGREEFWRYVNDFRLDSARERRDWKLAKELQRLRIEWSRKFAQAALDSPPEKTSMADRDRIQSLAVALHDLGEVQREAGEVDCISSYRESLLLAERANDRGGQIACAINLGNAHREISALSNLDEAERWYRRAMKLAGVGDRLILGKCLNNLGGIESARFDAGVKTHKTKGDLESLLTKQVKLHARALSLLPAEAVQDRAIAENGIALAFFSGGRFADSVTHYREAIRRFETVGCPLQAAGARFNTALALLKMGRVVNAMEYARSALQGYTRFGTAANEEIRLSEGLVAQIQKQITAKG